jgi:hypothetical protein
MPRSTDEIIRILVRLKEILAGSKESDWGALAPGEVIAILERELRNLHESGQLHSKTELASLFAPTAELQEISMANGWSDEYIRLSSAFDTAIRDLPDAF